MIDAVLFDWGGTLTPWKPPDERLWWRVAAKLVPAGLVPAGEVDRVGAAMAAADEAIWHRCKLEHRSGTFAEIFAAGGITDLDRAYSVAEAELDPFTVTDPEAAPMLRALRGLGLRVGVLSNTTWTRAHHERVFARDGVLDLFHGAVYTSEIACTKPHPDAFRAAMAAVGVADPARCVFVGDRLFDDIHGAGSLGMRTVLVPHSAIPPAQRGHTDGVPDAVVHRLSELPAVVEGWRSATATA